jgi:hypothetical protein
MKNEAKGAIGNGRRVAHERLLAGSALDCQESADHQHTVTLHNNQQRSFPLLQTEISALKIQPFQWPQLGNWPECLGLVGAGRPL